MLNSAADSFYQALKISLKYSANSCDVSCFKRENSCNCWGMSLSFFARYSHILWPFSANSLNGSHFKSRNSCYFWQMSLSSLARFSQNQWPFWLQWQVKNVFGNQNFDKSRQLSTIRLKEKMGEGKCKKLYWSFVKLSNVGNFPVFVFSPKYV